jgi:hypothetical protein
VESLTAEQVRLVAVVYTSALGPLLLLPLLRRLRIVPAWVPVVYAASFVACAIGWELWFTYGWVGGDPVDARRAPALSAAIPIHVNWLLNSLADAGSIVLGGLLLVWLAFGREGAVFRRWHWGAFALLLVWFLGQNVFVEMFLYHDQLAAGKRLSWAPLAPTGPWLNPTLFAFRDRTITLQGQLPWLLMTPLFYAALTGYLGRRQQPPQRRVSSIPGEAGGIRARVDTLRRGA